MSKQIDAAKRARLDAANHLLGIIGVPGNGARNADGPAPFLTLRAGQSSVYLTDAVSKTVIDTQATTAWDGFTGTPSLRVVIEHLRDFVLTGVKVPCGLFDGSWPDAREVFSDALPEAAGRAVELEIAEWHPDAAVPVRSAERLRALAAEVRATIGDGRLEGLEVVGFRTGMATIDGTGSITGTAIANALEQYAQLLDVRTPSPATASVPGAPPTPRRRR